MTVCDSESAPDNSLEMKAHRNSTGIVVRLLDHPILQRLALDPSLKVMVFCAGEAHGRQDISFPHQSELKVNGGEIKVNLRGLKNKPGSTRPVDITKELRLKSSTPAYENNVELLYALTNKVGPSQVRIQTSLSRCIDNNWTFFEFLTCSYSNYSFRSFTWYYLW